MPFFNHFTALKAVGLVLLAVGAVITYQSERIAVAVKKPQFNLAIKTIGLILTIAAFIIIMTAD